MVVEKHKPKLKTTIKSIWSRFKSFMVWWWSVDQFGNKREPGSWGQFFLVLLIVFGICFFILWWELGGFARWWDAR